MTFHGRRAEVGRVVASAARIVTILGPGGMGKTRLAQQIARALGDAWFCDLEGARSEADVLSTLARTLDIPLVTRGADPREQIADSIAARERVHLVLDNCEQVIDDVAAVVRALDRARGLRIIATSRERLRVAGEEVVELGPLSTDDAVALFVERAKLVQPSFDGEAERAVVESIVATLDGIPLAIELAAARMGVLSASALRDRLGLDLLAGRSRDATDRQRTMRAAIDWSWNNLTDDEQRALRATSVFRGGFDVAAAEAVIGVGALDLVEALRDKSLIRTFAGAGELRLGLYEPIRAYANEKLLLCNEEQTIAARHAAHYASLRFPPDALLAIEREAENLTAVSERALREDDARAFEEGAAALIAREPLGLLRGPVARWRDALDALLRRPAAKASSYRARLVLARGRARQLLGETTEARADAESVRGDGDPSIAARASWQVGSIAASAGDNAAARAAYDDALEKLARVRTRSAFDRETEVLALGNLGTVLREEAELVAAREHYDRALEAARDAGLRRLAGQYLGDLAALLHMAGDLEASTRAFGDAISALEAVGDRRLRALFLGARALVLQERGEFDSARADLDRAIAAQTLVGDRRYLGYLRGCRAQVDHEQDRPEDAERQYREAIATTRGVKNARIEGLFLGALSALLARSKPDEARTHLARAEELLRSVDDRVRLAAVQVHAAHLEADRDAVLARLAEGREHAAHSDDVRFAIRLAERLVADKGSNRDALLVALDGSSFRPPRGAVVDVSKKLAAKRLLAALAEARMNTPGRSLSTAALFAAGWPGERAKESAAANRVYVALASLRTLGLRGVLQSGDDGYRLDPSVRLLTTSV